MQCFAPSHTSADMQRARIRHNLGKFGNSGNGNDIYNSNRKCRGWTISDPSLWHRAVCMGDDAGRSGAFFVRRRRMAVSAATIVLACIALPGCGGSSSSTPPSTGSKGTPAGTYTATITATSGTLSHQISLTVIVQ